MKNKLKTSYHRVIRSISGCYPDIDEDSVIYKYPFITNEMNKIGIEELEIYMRRRRNSLIENMNKMPVYETIYNTCKYITTGPRNL